MQLDTVFWRTETTVYRAVVMAELEEGLPLSKCGDNHTQQIAQQIVQRIANGAESSANLSEKWHFRSSHMQMPTESLEGEWCNTNDLENHF